MSAARLEPHESPRIEFFSWNPRRAPVRTRFGWADHLGPRANNFGDLIGPLVVRAILDAAGQTQAPVTRRATLFTVGSVLHFAADGDVVWGTGRNGKIPDAAHHFTNLDVRAVRGPLTREFLVGRGISVPAVYGDPALLLPRLLPELALWAGDKRHDLTIVPNFNEFASFRSLADVLNPRQPLMHCLERIARSRMVVGSSLHGIVVAEALGIPARLIASQVEQPFKYLDYYRGSGRDTFTPTASVEQAVAMGGEPPAEWDSDALLAAFPRDLWR